MSQIGSGSGRISNYLVSWIRIRNSGYRSERNICGSIPNHRFLNIYKKISRANYQLMDRAKKIATCGKVWLIKNDSLMYAD
jgi:hypothetical protein